MNNIVNGLMKSRLKSECVGDEAGYQNGVTRFFSCGHHDVLRVYMCPAVWIDDKTGSQSISDSLLHVLHMLRIVIYSVTILSYGKVFTGKLQVI